SVCNESEHLELARRQVGGIPARRCTRAAGQAPGTSLTEPARDDLSGRMRPERTKLVERAAKSIVVICIGKSKRGLVGAADLAPQLRGAHGVARDLSGVRLGYAPRDFFRDPCLPTPVGKLPDHPRRPTTKRQAVQLVCSLHDRVGAALEPGCLCPGGNHRCEVLEVTRRSAELERFVERRPWIRISAARTDEPKDNEPENPQQVGIAPLTKHERGGLDRLVPPP